MVRNALRKSGRGTIVAVGCLFLSLAACEREGPLERTGEELDEAVQTIRKGEEPASTKLDDAVDDLREGVNDATDELNGE